MTVLEGADDHRRRHPDARADPARGPARRVLRGPPVRGGVAVPPVAAPGRARPGLALPRDRPGPPARRRDGRGAAAVARRDVRRSRHRRRARGGGCSGRSPTPSTSSPRTSSVPVLRLPAHPVRMAQFGLRAGLPASVSARVPRRAGQGAVRRLGRARLPAADRPATASVGVMLFAAGHRHGWPVAEGGSAAITGALASPARSLGGTVVTGVTRAVAGRPARRRACRCSTPGPSAVADILGDQLPARTGRAYRRWKYGPARVQGRPRRRGRRALDRRGGSPRRHRAPRRHARGDRHRRGRRLRRADARSAVRPGRPAVPGRPDPGRR